MIWAAAGLAALVYDELQPAAASRLAEEKPGQTLQPTALVHGLMYVWSGAVIHRLGVAAATCTRCRGGHAPCIYLIDNARRKLSVKHGRGLAHQEAALDDLALAHPHDPLELLAVHEALHGLAAKCLLPWGVGQAPLLSRMYDG